MYRIPLRVRGVDFEHEATLNALGEHLADLAWSSSDGGVVAVVHTDSRSPVGAALEAARRIVHFLPEAEVLEVDQELVGVSDVAHRLGVSREAVRLWVEGLRGPGGFPSHVGTVANGRTRLWRWSEVNSWLRKNYHLGDDLDHLNLEQLAELNAALLGVKNRIDNEWQAVSSYEQHLDRHAAPHDHLKDLILLALDRVAMSRAKGHMKLALSMMDRPPTVVRYGRNWSPTHVSVLHSPVTPEERE